MNAEPRATGSFLKVGCAGENRPRTGILALFLGEVTEDGEGKTGLLLMII